MKKASFSHHWRINHQIHAKELRVLDSNGKQIGIMTREEALKKALVANADLIEIAPNANPPVAKIEDFGKFKYKEEKKIKKAKKGVKKGDTKEIRFTPFIGDADFETRIKRIDKFFKEGNKVRINVRFSNKQMGSKQFGYEIVKRVINSLNGRANLDMEPKFLGRSLIAVISPNNKSKKQSENAKTQNEKVSI
ncbi:MAG: translation initiation factor IF-3 [Patescibacteria group bacterium]|nr:translation initiation factor IF-3 [Patescibacteria group bacterium]